MHIFFSGIGGTGIGPLALIAKEAGYNVSGSDKQDSQYVEYLRSHGIKNIHIGQTEAAIDSAHKSQPIDWFVYSSALDKENPNHPELLYVRGQGIKHSKRDEFLNQVLKEKNLKLIAIAGTHGKTTTTAMAIWLFKELGLPISYSVGAKIPSGEMGAYDPASQYFVYECDEFDRNFLAFHPLMSLISGIAWDHHEVFPTKQDYQDAFRTFLGQSEQSVLWQEDLDSLSLKAGGTLRVLSPKDQGYNGLTLPGEVNRRDAWLAVDAVRAVTGEPLERLVGIMNEFPGLSRRMEQIKPGLFSDYAHTPEKISGAMQTALEIAKENGKKVVVIYEPLTNRRMHFTREQHASIFKGASKIYWVPSYLAREDPNQPVLAPAELIRTLDPDLRLIAMPMELNAELKETISLHLSEGDMVVALSGGGANSLDEWLRKEFS